MSFQSQTKYGAKLIRNNRENFFDLVKINQVDFCFTFWVVVYCKWPYIRKTDSILSMLCELTWLSSIQTSLSLFVYWEIDVCARMLQASSAWKGVSMAPGWKYIPNK
jgi:hypothetical protein